MLKLPTLFGKTPKHQKFSFEPRYYDAAKEEREQRNKRIRQELEKEKQSNDNNYADRIRGSFHSSRKRTKVTNNDLHTALLRIGILLFLVCFIIAYLEWGNKAFYGFAVFVPLYVWTKIRK